MNKLPLKSVSIIEALAKSLRERNGFSLALGLTLWNGYNRQVRAAVAPPMRIVTTRNYVFQYDLTGWGFNIERRVQRLLEVSRWAGTNRDYEIYQMSHAGRLTQLPTFDLGLGI